MVAKIALLLIAAHLSVTLALPPCVCTRNFRPVCGSDGKTYSNQCLLNCEKTSNNKDLSTAWEGPCEVPQQSVDVGCICTLEYRPVCGTDGTTYPNSCSLRCQRSSVPDLEVKYNGQCENEQVKVATPDFSNVKVVDFPACTCGRDAKPVCGSDGVTYANDCLLNCQTAHNPSLSIKSWGPCEPSNVVEPTDCTCTRNYEPVCGANGVTYGNMCLMNCAGVQLGRPALCGNVAREN